MYFSPPTKCFYENVLSHNYKLHNYNLPAIEILRFSSCLVSMLLWKKAIFHEIKTNKQGKSKKKTG